MNKAANLLPEIVRLILQTAVGTGGESGSANVQLGEWKKQLALIGVCRKWRAAGLPLVYSHVIIESKEAADGSKTVDTNAVLFGGSRGQPTELARSLTIMMVAYSRVDVFIDNVCDTLALARGGDKASQRQWRRISRMTIDLCAGRPYLFSSTPHDDNSGRGQAAEEALAPQMLAERLAYVVPNVRTLHCAPSQNIEDCAAFTASLANRYAGQIERLKTHVHAPFAAPAMENVRALDLFFFWSGVQISMPRINSIRMLQRLSLVNVSADFAWDALFPVQQQQQMLTGAGPANSELPVAEFESLRRMHLFFHTHADVFEQNARASQLLGPQFQRRLSFPSLRYFCTDNSASAAALLDGAHFPDRLAELRVFCPEGAIVSIKNADFTADNRRRIAAHMATTHHETLGPWDFVRLTNCLFSSRASEHSADSQSASVVAATLVPERIDQDMALTMGAHMFLPKPAVIDWPLLTRLSIAAPICPFALVQYIGALSGLLELRIHSLQLGSVVLHRPADTHADAGTSTANLCLWPPPEPSSAASLVSKSPLRFLALAFDIHDNGDIGASVVQHLATRLHSLRSLCIPDPLAPRIQEFAVSQQPTFSHLAALTVY
ncbi:hypothetical protein LPJ72_003461 [Coemansia sp. Benny D160-2]|nr:hypothetical protein LPJ72_003461 [Coemansia sp. Benny D160-2]